MQSTFSAKEINKNKNRVSGECGPGREGAADGGAGVWQERVSTWTEHCRQPLVWAGGTAAQANTGQACRVPGCRPTPCSAWSGRRTVDEATSQCDHSYLTSPLRASCLIQKEVSKFPQPLKQKTLASLPVPQPSANEELRSLIRLSLRCRHRPLPLLLAPAWFINKSWEAVEYLSSV